MAKTKVKINTVKNIAKKKTKADRAEDLDLLINEINKNISGSGLKLASELKVKDRLFFGIPDIDDFIKGLPTGGFTNIFGRSSSGKSTLMMHLIAESQRKGLTCCYLDLEGGFDKTRATALGVNLDRLLLVQTSEYAEKAFDLVIELTKTKKVDLIIIDSIQATAPKEELYEGKTKNEKSTADATMALLAKKIGLWFRKSVGRTSKNNVAVVIISQVREKIGLYGAGGEDFTGGNALRHYPLLAINLKRSAISDSPFIKKQVEEIDKNGKIKLKEIDIKVGFGTVIKLEKVKVTTRDSEGSSIVVPCYYDTGFKTPDYVATKTVSDKIEDEIEANNGDV